MSLPVSMQYNLGGSQAIPSRTRLARFDSTNSSYVSESNNKIIIPISADGFINTEDAYLYMTITNNSTTQPATLDGNAACVINKVDIAVQGSSGKVETLDRYSLYHLYDELWNMSSEELNWLNATSGGCVIQESPLGWSPIGDALAAGGGAASWTVKLKCGFLNDLYKKALPQGLPQFQLEITLNSAVSAFTHHASAAAHSYTVNNVRFYAPVYQILDESIMAQYNNQLRSSATSWVGKAVGTIINSSATGASVQSFQLNPSYKSLNALVTLNRQADKIAAAASDCNTAFNLTGVTEFKYVLNGMNTPSDGIQFTAATDLARAYIEGAKSHAPHGHAYAKNHGLTALRFGAGNAIGAAAGSGCLAVSLKRFTSDPNLIFQGLNTAASSAPSTLQVTFDSNNAAAQDVTTFAYYDCMWTLTPDGMVVATF